PAPRFPFIALLVSGGHTQLMRVQEIGRYELLGETVDDAAGEAFDKSAKLLGLGYPGGPALAKLAASGNAERFNLPRPMVNSGDLNFSFSGLKTAVLTVTKREALDDQGRADLAASTQAAIVDVLAEKSLQALALTGVKRLVVAGGVGANQGLRERLTREGAAKNLEVFYPQLEFCTDNGAMIALAGALRLRAGALGSMAFGVKPRWDLETLMAGEAHG
ncbi:MAG: tRNA (adenosine(37)-N6)-threonylcarbamoyltransferase complex transferase subunit TsaD, partial [Pseudomonadota bacterium]|nr:tRNA (adenosine(37)-N6)-threonylcarbamoyltransferase complex transferase subunit TsaD [Pseudomonadota bacterium]